MSQRRWRWLSLVAMWLLLLLQTLEASGGRLHADGQRYDTEKRREYDVISLLIKRLDNLQETEVILADSFEEEAGKQWMEDTNNQLRHHYYTVGLNQFIFSTNITDYNKEKLLAEQNKCHDWKKARLAEGRKFDYNNFRSRDLRRQFRHFLTTADPSDPNAVALISELHSNMTSLFSTAKVCLDDVFLHRVPRDHGNQDCRDLEPDITDLLVTSRDPKVLEAVWKKWRDAAGKPQRDNYVAFVNALNSGARENGFHDYGAYWREEMFPDHTDVIKMAADLWEELRPLYLQIHAYVRRKLREYYGSDVVGTDGTIPAHLLGNMWAQEWQGIFPLVTPYTDASASGDIEQVLKVRYDVMDLFRLSERFYASLGLFNMTETFWRESMFTRPKDRKVTCHASAEDLFKTGDFRIKMCSEVSREYLKTIHHEMGHVEYFMAYEHQPAVYRDGANCAFHEAIGDTVALSVMSPTHLRVLSLTDRDERRSDEEMEEKKTINSLMQMALMKIGFLPFGLVVDRWRWGVFDGTTPPSRYNRDWWQLRLDLQGLRAPVPRSEKDFDPAAKFHIPSNSPYMCYFVSHVLQFQFYQRLCDLSGHQGPLHLCDIQDSKTAGAAFKRLLSAGSSRPWQDVLEEFTGSRETSATAILDYFRPLHDWLKEDNARHNEAVGWEGATINWSEE